AAFGRKSGTFFAIDVASRSASNIRRVCSAAMQAGDEITIEPTELVAGGAALARIDGFPIFAASVYPGDVARVRLTEVKKGFARAELLNVITSSALRRAAPCPIAGECGGCDWTALRLDAQLAAKKR